MAPASDCDDGLAVVFLRDSDFVLGPLVMGRILSGQEEDDVAEQHLTLDGDGERLDGRRVVDRVVFWDAVVVVPEVSRGIEKGDEPLVGTAVRPGMTDEQASRPHGQHGSFRVLRTTWAAA